MGFLKLSNISETDNSIEVQCPSCKRVFTISKEEVIPINEGFEFKSSFGQACPNCHTAYHQITSNQMEIESNQVFVEKPIIKRSKMNRKVKQTILVSIIFVSIIVLFLKINSKPSLTDTQIEDKAITYLQEQVKNDDWIDDPLDITTDQYVYDGVRIYVKDNFFDKSLKEQCTLSAALYDTFDKKVKELGNTSDYTIIICNNNKEFFIYTITKDNFKFISTGLEVPRNQITNGQFDFNKLDKAIVNNGTINGKNSAQVSKEADEALANAGSIRNQNSQVPSDEDKGFAWSAAIDTVKRNLKAPSTAKFPFSYNGQDIEKTSADTFVVNSYVDAQNGFGAMVRSNFSVTIKKTGSDSYTVKNIHIDQ